MFQIPFFKKKIPKFWKFFLDQIFGGISKYCLIENWGNRFANFYNLNNFSTNMLIIKFYLKYLLMMVQKNKKQKHYVITIISLIFIKPSEGLGLSQKQNN